MNVTDLGIFPLDSFFFFLFFFLHFAISLNLYINWQNSYTFITQLSLEIYLSRLVESFKNKKENKELAEFNDIHYIFKQNDDVIHKLVELKKKKKKRK